MKKILRIVCLTVLLSSVLLSGFCIVTVQATNEYDANIIAPESLIGTWRRTNRESRVLVFREDGTGLRGAPGIRREITWSVVDGELRTSPFFGRFSFEDNILTVRDAASPAGGATTDTYVFYSEAIDLYGEESWFVFFVALPLLGIGVIFHIWRWHRKERKSANTPRRLGS